MPDIPSILPSWLGGLNLNAINPSSIINIVNNFTSIKQADVMGIIAAILAIINLVLVLSWILQIRNRNSRR
jgi:predicted permease